MDENKTRLLDEYDARPISDEEINKILDEIDAEEGDESVTTPPTTPGGDPVPPEYEGDISDQGAEG